MIRSNKIQLSLFVVSLLVMIISCGTASAQNRVVVIPMLGDAKPLQNIITVAKSNGDFTNPIAAMNSITDASNSNTYLIVVGPGTYTLSGQLVMKDHVSITGSGIETTELHGSVGANGFTESAALIIGAEGVEISNMTIRNGAVEEVVIGIHSSQEDMRLTRVRVITDSGVGSKYAIVNHESELKLYDSVILNIGGFGSCYGIYSYSNAVLKVNNMDMRLDCNNGAQYGVFVNAASFSFIDNAFIEIDYVGVGTENSYGYFSNGNNSKGYISNSIIGGEDISVYGGASTGIYYITHISNSDLRSNGSGNVNCNFTRLYTGFSLDDECSSF